MSLYPLIESGTSPVSPCIAMLGHDFDKPRIYFKAFLCIMSALELLELSNRSVPVNVLRPLSVVVAQFSTLYKIIGDISEWNGLVGFLVGMLNLDIAHKKRS